MRRHGFLEILILLVFAGLFLCPVTASGITTDYNLTITNQGTGTGKVTINSPGIDCGSTCNATFSSGTDVTLTANPNGDSTFTGWSGDCSLCGTTTDCLLTMDSDKNCTATFTLKQYTITANASGNGTGTVQSDVGGINYSYPGTSTGSSSPIDHGSSVTITATADTGSTASFGGTRQAAGGSPSGNGTAVAACDLAVNSALTLTATFTSSYLDEVNWDTNDTVIPACDDCDLENTWGARYSLPFQFTFFGRTIVAINVNTNGLIELLEDGEASDVGPAYGTHWIGAHRHRMDAIFAGNDDLVTGVIIEGSSNRVEIAWVGTTFADRDFGGGKDLLYKVILFSDGRIQWKFFNMDYASHDYDLFSGIYANDPDDVEIEIPGGSASVSGDNVNKIFEFDPQTQNISEKTWDQADTSIPAGDNADLETGNGALYTMPFTFNYFGRNITALNVNTNGLVELLEDTETSFDGSNPGTHDNGNHTGNMDAIFAGNDDLVTGVVIEGSTNRVEIAWTGSSKADNVFEGGKDLLYKVILFSDGRIRWKFFDMDYVNHDFDLFSGIYAKEEGIEVEIPGGSTSFTGDRINRIFEFSAYTLTVGTTGNGTVTSDDNGISCGTGGSDCSEPYDIKSNASVTLTAKEDSGYIFGGWGGDCSSCESTADCTITMDASKTCTALFHPPTVDLTVNVTGSGSGTVTSNDDPQGINCGSDCSETYDYNTTITLTATAEPGSVFTGWDANSDCGNCGTSASCDVTMDAARTCTAAFEPGVTVISPDGGEKIESGGTYTITWTAPVEATTFDLEYSINDGNTWKPIASRVTETSYDWQVPAVAGNKRKCLVRVTGYDDTDLQVGQDTSDAWFTIEVIRIKTPNGGETYGPGNTVPITWVTNATQSPITKVVIKYHQVDVPGWNLITVIKGSNPGTYSWTIPDTLAEGGYRIKVNLWDANRNRRGADKTDGTFAVSSGQ